MEDRQMKKTLSSFVVILLIAGMLLSACAKAAAPTAAPLEPTKAPEVMPTDAPKADPLKGMKVCYLIPDASNSFLSALTEAVKGKFAVDGVEVLVASADGDATKQFNQIENCISSKVNAMIVMAAIDPVAVVAAVEEAKKAGIKVMGVPVDNQGPYDSIMHTDQREIGVKMAGMGCDFINKTYPDAGNQGVEVAIMSTENSAELKKRTDGMRTIADTCPKAKVVTYVDVPNASITNGLTAAENIFTAYPNVKVFLSIGDSGSQGIAQAIQAYAPNDLSKYAVFSGDVSPENRAVIEGCQSPYRGAVAIGGGPEELATSTYNIVKSMLAGEKYPTETLDPLITITCKQ
jgi:ribose transport system substrate-binding protein